MDRGKGSTECKKNGKRGKQKTEEEPRTLKLVRVQGKQVV